MVHLKRMEESDIIQVAAMEKEIFSVPWSQKGFYDTLYMDNVCFFVAREGDMLLGYCGLYMAADEGEITNVAVSEEARRTGVASSLLQALLEEGQRKSITRFFLEVRVSNTPAIGLYEKYGFQICGTRKGFYEKPKEDAYLMCRE